MKTRIDLHNELLTYADNVYFQPPESIRMKYPCIVYRLDGVDTKSANDGKYIINKRYFIQYIHSNPDDEVGDKIILIPHCSSAGRSYIDGLYHDNFNLYI